MANLANDVFNANKGDVTFGPYKDKGFYKII